MDKKTDSKQMSKAEVHEELQKTKAKLHEERKIRRDLAQELAAAPGRQIHGFIDFIRERGVVGLAVGLANQIVNAVIVPFVNLFLGANGLAGWKVTVHLGRNESVFLLGSLADALIKFIAIAAVIYFVVMGLKLDRLDKKKDA
jgi:large conductance mechanosensitive channel